MSNVLKGLICFVICAGLVGHAAANRLADKWKDQRYQANLFGDMAKSGNKGILKQLKAMSQNGNPAATQNLGWLNENGAEAIGIPKNPKLACDYYEISASRGYPPGLYAYGMCLYSGPLTRKGDKQQRKKALGLLEQAARSGWVMASVQLALYHVGLPLKEGEELRSYTATQTVDAAAVQAFVRLGLDSRPSQDQKTTLNFVLGLAATKSRDIPYRLGDEALRYAVDNGYKPASRWQGELRNRWLLEMEHEWLTAGEDITSVFHPRGQAGCFGMAANGELTASDKTKCKALFDEAEAIYEAQLSDIQYAFEHFYGAEDIGLDHIELTLNENFHVFAQEWNERYFMVVGE